MSAFEERINQDLRKLRELSAATNNRVKLLSTSGHPTKQIDIELNYPTALSASYPSAVQRQTKVRVELLSRYPFTEPTATITTPIFHPNVFSTGKICFGTKWLPSDGLDLLVRRIIQIITFDPLLLNGDSPANRTALDWYLKAVKQHPGAFPTDRLEVKETSTKKKISWSDIPQSTETRVVIICSGCGAGLRVLAGKTGNVACPKCKRSFLAKT